MLGVCRAYSGCVQVVCGVYACNSSTSCCVLSTSFRRPLTTDSSCTARCVSICTFALVSKASKQRACSFLPLILASCIDLKVESFSACATSAYVSIRQHLKVESFSDCAAVSVSIRTFVLVEKINCASVLVLLYW
jgi:hypothetical protein